MIAEHFQFHCPNQAVGESVAEHVAEIRQLTRHCEFGAYLDDLLRDRFVCGLQSKTIQKKLLMETDLTLQRAVKIAHTMETAAKNGHKLQSPSCAAEPMPHSRNIGKVSSNDKARPRTVLLQVWEISPQGRPVFLSQKAKYHNFGKTGHLRSVCRQPKKPPKHPRAQGSQSRQKVQLVEEDVNSEILVLY